MVNELLYKRNPVGSVANLSRWLEKRQDDLLDLASRANELYRVVEEKPKSNGGTRIILDALPPLKDLQNLINRRIFCNVQYPCYLQGGIYDPESPRSYIADASLHIGAKTLISQDIKDFFPSITYEHVLAIWKYLFHFPPEVAHCLTQLVTHHGSLPQGAITSPAIANMVFFQSESRLVHRLGELDIRYTRYVDDISASATRRLSSHEINEALSAIIGMILRYGFKPHREPPKLLICFANERMH